MEACIFPISTLAALPMAKVNSSNVPKIYNTNFINNSGVIGAALSLNLTKITYPDDPLVYIIENCSFVNNSGSPGSALAVSQVDTFGTIGSPPSLKLAIQLVFRNCSFFGNSYPSIFRPNSIQNFEQDLFNVVFLHLVQDITFINCTFKGNNGTALYTYGTPFSFLRRCVFLAKCWMEWRRPVSQWRLSHASPS